MKSMRQKTRKKMKTGVLLIMLVSLLCSPPYLHSQAAPAISKIEDHAAKNNREETSGAEEADIDLIKKGIEPGTSQKTNTMQEQEARQEQPQAVQIQEEAPEEMQKAEGEAAQKEEKGEAGQEREMRKAEGEAAQKEEKGEAGQEREMQKAEAVQQEEKAEVSKVRGGTAENGLSWRENHYELYIKGVKVIEKGWKEISGEKFYVDDRGYVTTRMEKTGGVWKLYLFDPAGAGWKLQKDVWESILEKEYYFDPEGICITIYDPQAEKCQTYADGRMKALTKDICVLRNGKLYYFNAQGTRVTQKGWQKVSGGRYVQVGKPGYVNCKMEKSKGIWQFFKYDYKEGIWEKQKDAWKTVDGKEYYFNKAGICSKIYDKKNRMCQKYAGGKMKAVRKDVCTLRNGKLYLFDSKGIQVTGKGWKTVSEKKLVQIKASGYVTAKVERVRGSFQYYKFDYSGKQWKKQKKLWLTAKKKKYYFGGSGLCTRLYDSAAKKCYDYKDGKMTLVKNDTRVICGKEYYFCPDGGKAGSMGLYQINAGRLVYVQADGRVTKKIRGQVLACEKEGQKVISCRVKESDYMCYYNAEGAIKRKIYLKGAMVALTYDDGPSQYTPAVLDVLGQYGGTATFFVVGQRVPLFPDALMRAYQMGCEIGNHTYSHQILTKADAPTVQSQISATNLLVQSVTGASPAVMRPPGGGQNDAVRSMVGMPLILWSIDTLDWKTRNALSTQAAVLNHVRDGDIILMHDLYQQTAEASRVMIPELTRRGYQLVTVSELADCRGGMTNGMVYRAFR